MKRLLLPVLLPVIPMLLSACAMTAQPDDAPENNPVNDAPGANDVIICEQPRPQVCTREYNPVCARTNDGTTRTYSTGCTSCADESVVSYRAGQC